MARPSTPGGLRQRKGDTKKSDATAPIETDYSKLAKAHQGKVKEDKERDYKIAFVVITILAFVTRFWGISHPNEVVFDEVHFGKVRLHRFPESIYPSSADFARSLPPITSSEPTSSMSTLLSPSSFSPLWAGSLATMATSTSRTSAIPT